jgi:hypothetical protein
LYFYRMKASGAGRVYFSHVCSAAEGMPRSLAA